MTADTNPRPCGICGESCGWTVQGGGHRQCATLGTLWTDDSPTGMRFIARLLGVERETVEKWRVRGLFPPPSWPVAETGGSPQWRRAEVLEWAKRTGRL